MEYLFKGNGSKGVPFEYKDHYKRMKIKTWTEYADILVSDDSAIKRLN